MTCVSSSWTLLRMSPNWRTSPAGWQVRKEKPRMEPGRSGRAGVREMKEDPECISAVPAVAYQGSAVRYLETLQSLINAMVIPKRCLPNVSKVWLPVAGPVPGVVAAVVRPAAL